MTLRDCLQLELAQAIRRRDRSVVAVFRSALSALSNAEATPPADNPSTSGSTHVAGAAHGVGSAQVERLHLTDEQQREIIAAEAVELSAHVEQLESLGRRDEADAVRRALRILTSVLDASR